MQEKVHISENRSKVTFIETKNNKKALASSTHFKTTKTVAENGYC